MSERPPDQPIVPQSPLYGVERSLIEKGGNIVFEKVEGNKKLAICHKHQHGGGSMNAVLMHHKTLLQIFLQKKDDLLKHLIELRDSIGSKNIRFIFESTAVAGKDWPKYGEQIGKNFTTVRQISEMWANPQTKPHMLKKAMASIAAMDVLVKYLDVYNRFALDCYDKGLGDLILPGRLPNATSSGENEDTIYLLSDKRFERMDNGELEVYLTKWKINARKETILRHTFMHQQMTYAPKVAVVVSGSGHFKSGSSVAAPVDPPMEDFLGGFDAFVVEPGTYRQLEETVARNYNLFDGTTATPQELREHLSRVHPDQLASMIQDERHRMNLRASQSKVEGRARDS